MSLRAARVTAWAAALALALGLGACATAPVGPKPKAEQVWEAFAAARAAAARTTAGFSASGSLNFSGPDKSMRVTLQFWGNPGAALRMDMSAGFGTPVALWSEDASGIRGYFPLERVLYAHPDPRAGAARMGLGIPLGLADMAAMATGTYAGLVPQSFAGVDALENGTFRFAFTGPGPVSTLTLDAAGRPMVFAGRLLGRVWTLEALDYEDGAAPPVPTRFRLEMQGGIRAVIRVKELERRPVPWPGSRLALDVPENTRLVRLDIVESLKK